MAGEYTKRSICSYIGSRPTLRHSNPITFVKIIKDIDPLVFHLNNTKTIDRVDFIMVILVG